MSRVVQKSSIYSAVSLVLIAAFSIFQFRKFLYWNFDDSFIVYRVVRNLLHAHSWAFNLGEAVNASTSALHTILIAIAAWFVSDIPLGAHIIGGLALLLAGVGIRTVFLRRFGEPFATGAGLLAVYHLSENATWGLETNLFAALLIFAALVVESRTLIWVVLGVCTLVRPDGLALFVIVLSFRQGWFLSTKPTKPWREALRPCLIFCLVLLPWAAFSLSTFGSIFPDTLSSKVWQGNSGYWGPGFVYARALRLHFLDIGLLGQLVSLASIFGLRLLWRERHPLLIIVAFVALQQAIYVLLNVPGYHWYFAYLDFALLLSAIYFLTEYIRRHSVHPSLTFYSFSLFVIILGQYMFRKHEFQPYEVRDVAYTAAARTISSLAPATIATLEVGSIGYVLDWPIIDLVGLTSQNKEYISGKHLDEFFQAPPEYVLLHSPPWPMERSILDDPRFQWGYTLKAQFPHVQFGLDLFRLEHGASEIKSFDVPAYVRAHYQEFEQVDSRQYVLIERKKFLCALDHINGRVGLVKKLDLPRRNLNIRGWAAARARGKLGDKAQILIRSERGEIFVRPAERVQRPDVAAHLSNNSFEWAGLVGQGSALSLAAGKYQVGFAELVDGHYEYCVVPIKLTLY